MKMRSLLGFIVLSTSLVIILTVSFSHTADPKRYLLYGQVVQKNGTAKKEYVYVEDGLIKSITQKKPKLLKNTKFIYLQGYIFPGLIDLHSHISYNILPVWENARSQFTNRFQWRKDKSYREGFRSIYKAIDIDEYKTGLVLFDELQALAGGTTLVQESSAMDSEVDEFTKRLVVRGTGYQEDLGLDNGKKIFSTIDMFEPRANFQTVPKSSLDSFAKKRAAGTLQAFIAHLAEGRTGFLRTDQTYDVYSRNEFEALMNNPYFSDPEHTPKPPICLIHSSGIDPQNEKHINFLKTWNMGIVWSPVSNLLLYGDTLDVETLLKNGIPIALGSDWSPSGSKHVLDEARFAKFYLNEIGAQTSDEEIYHMITSNPAQMIGHPGLGEIKEGALADLFILEDPNPDYTPMQSLFQTDVKYITMVMIRGRFVYGYEENATHIFEQNGDSIEKEGMQALPQSEGPAIKNKVVYIDPVLNINVTEVINNMDVALEKLGIHRNNLLTSTDQRYQDRMFELKQFVFTKFLKEKK